MLENTTFWYALALLIFVALTFRTIRGAVVQSLDAYADRVMSEVQEAERLKREAHESLLAAKQRQIEVDNEVRDLIERARVQSVDIRKSAHSDLEKMLARRKQQVKQRIEQARQGVVQEVRSAMIETAVQAVANQLQSSISSSDSKTLVGAAIGDLPSHLAQTNSASGKLGKKASTTSKGRQLH